MYVPVTIARRAVVLQTQRAPTSPTEVLQRTGPVVGPSNATGIMMTEVVDANNFSSHIVQHHKSLAATQDMQEQFKRDVSRHLPWGFAPFPVPAPKQPTPEIYGLKQAFPSYMVCSICNHAYTNAKTFKLHPCLQNNSFAEHFKSPAQRFSQHPYHGWFPVIVQPPSVIPNPRSAWEAYQEQMREAIPASSSQETLFR